MRRPYTTFQSGLPGIGLLLLRTAVGVKLVREGFAYLMNSQGLRPQAEIACLVALGTGVSLALGFLTPLAAGISVLGGAAAWFWHPSWASSFADLPTLNTMVVTIAILLLGPGAISLDALFFGRRKVVIPRVVRS